MTMTFEDEKAILEEENNCFGYIDGECTILKRTALLTQDHLNCGTLRCPFYKPADHATSIKTLSDDDEYQFETKSEYEKRTGKSYLTVDDIQEYECYPHDDWEEVERKYRKFIPDPTLNKMKKPELIERAKSMGLDVSDEMMKNDIILMISEVLRVDLEQH